MQSTLDNEVKSDMIWRPPTRLPPTLPIHSSITDVSAWAFFPFPAGPAPQDLAAGVGAMPQPCAAAQGGVLLPGGAFPGHLPWHKTSLHLICGPATKLHRHTEKLGQLEKFPRAHCQVCDHCVTGPAAETTWCWWTCPALPGSQPFGRHQGGRLRGANQASLF